jgi:hypothetical protein
MLEREKGRDKASMGLLKRMNDIQLDLASVR